MHIDWALTLAGAGVGFVVGLTGMGGGALMTPVLILAFGMSPAVAVSSDLVAAVVMKPVGGGVHLRRGTVDLQLVKWLVAGSVPTAFGSVWALRQFSDPGRVDTLVQYSVGAALLLAAASMVIKGAFSGRDSHRVPGPAPTPRPLPTVLVGVFGGAVVGLTSVGSGSLMMVLLMIVYPTLSASELVGTDLVQAIPLVAAAGLGHVLFGHVDLAVTVPLVLGSVPAVYLGARLSSRSPDRVIRPVLALVLIMSGLKMVHVPDRAAAAIGLLALISAITVLVRSPRSPRSPSRPRRRSALHKEGTRAGA